MTNQTIVYIVNPKAGGKGLKVLPKLNELIKKFSLEAVIEKTEYAGHAKEIVKKYISRGIKKIVAIGGDGTVNEIASEIVHTDTAISIIPMGSGNGLARFLRIPMNFEKAFEVSLGKKINIIDTGIVNEKPFFCTMGVGFDALCAADFAKGKHNRGLKNYIKVIIKNYFDFKGFKAIFNDQTDLFFSLTFANASQFGNNAYIAPDAIINDGMLDCTVIHLHPKWYGFVLGYLLMTKNIRTSKFVEYYRSSKFEIEGHTRWQIHIDGETVLLDSPKLKINILPKSLKVIVPEN